jgi:hypothetical protein
MCGLSTTGTHVCLAAAAADVHGGMGCAMAQHGDEPSAAMVLALMFGLWLKLARMRKRE